MVNFGLFGILRVYGMGKSHFLSWLLTFTIFDFGGPQGQNVVSFNVRCFRFDKVKKKCFKFTKYITHTALHRMTPIFSILLKVAPLDKECSNVS